MNIFTFIISFLFIISCQVKQENASNDLFSGHKPAANEFVPDALLSGSFKSGDNLDITLRFPFEVFVAGGIPRLSLDVGGVTKYANYSSGDGTKVLIFRYTVADGDTDANGISVASTIDLNGATLKFSSSISVLSDCALTFSPPSGASVFIDTTLPTQSSYNYSGPNLYSLDQIISVMVVYSEPVVVTGLPRVLIDLGGSTKNANYVSGSGTTSLVFTYKVAAADKDLDGLNISGVSLNSGAIKDAAGNTAPFSLAPAAMVGVYAHDFPTKVNSTAKSANGTYLSGETISFSLVFSRAITVTGTPRIPLTVGSSTRYANYVSGSGSSTLVFNYVVTDPDYDSNGITVTPLISLNGGTLIDTNGDSVILLTFTPGSTASLNVDGVIPFISSLTVPANGTYIIGQNMNFTAVFSQAVTVTGSPSIDFVLGSTTVNAVYVSGSGTTNILFRYIPVSGDLDSNGIALSSLSLNSGTIQSSSLNNANTALTTPTTTGILVNGVTPTLVSVNAPANATYLVGNNMNFTATFSSAVTVTGSPSISFSMTSGTKNAVYLSGSGTSTLTFRYTVASSDYDYDGISLTSPVLLNGGTIQDGNGYNSTLTFTPPNTTSVLVDASPALITSVSVPSFRTYGNGEVLNFTVNFTRIVNVTGAPRITLTIGSSTVYANYVSGSGTSALVFRKIIASLENDTDGIVLTSPIALNGGTIKDSNTSNAILTFTVPSTSGILVDSDAPNVSNITAPANATYLTSQNLNFVLDFNENVTITGSPRLVLNIGGTIRYANYVSGSGGTIITFRHTVVSGDSDSNGITMSSSLDLNSGTIVDASSNPANLSLTAPSLGSVLVDAILPTVSSVTLPSNSVFTNAGQLNFTITYSKPITVTGTPRLHLVIGSSTVFANYVSGSGTSALLFRYTLTATNFDMDGIALGNSNDIDLNAGTMRDAVNNTASVNIGAQNLSKVFVTYSGLGAWFDSNDATTITTVFVSPNFQTSNWNDKSGGNKNATQATAANRPFYVSSGFGTQNRPYINTNLATHFMDLATAIPLVRTVFIVFRTPPTLANATLFSGVTASIGMGATGTLTFNPTASWKVNGGALQATTTATAASTVTVNTNYIITAQFAAGQNITTQRLGHATTSMLNGRIAEILVFTSSATLTNTEMTVIHNYLNTKYGVY